MEVKPIGPTVVYEPSNGKLHDLDIVFVHGLFGHPKKSWSLNVPIDGSSNVPHETSNESDTELPPRKKRRTKSRELFREVFWPQHLLPEVFPQARVLTWGYGVQIEQLLNSTSQASLFHHAENLLSDLVMLRKTEVERRSPLLFIAHSLGGIVVKDALGSSGQARKLSEQIVSATLGVMFLGTPHYGSNVASLGKIVFELSKVFLKKPNLQILRGLETDSEILERISRSFGQILAAARIKVHSFREELPTKGVMIVSPASSTTGYLHETRGSLHANHRNMAKFSSPEEIKFQRVTSVLRDWVNEYFENQKSLQNCHVMSDTCELPDWLVFDKELQMCLRTLYSRDAKSRFEDVEPTFRQTYSWLFDRKVGFEDWLQGKVSSNIYWIQGKPASGKSTLMKFAMTSGLTREFLKQYDENYWVVAGFFFHDRGTSAQKSTEGFLQHILHQLLMQQNQLFELIYPIFKRVLEEELGWSTDSVRPLPIAWNLDSVRKALTLIGRKSITKVNICLFVDALDEHAGGHRELILILKDIAEFTKNPFFRVRLILAGRPENVFRTAFQDCPGFSIHNHTTEDIRQYTKGRVQQEWQRVLTTQPREELEILTERIVEKAEGVFLWVKLVVDEIVEGLCEGDTDEELETLLSTMPTELGDLYTRALRRRSRSSLEIIAKYPEEAYVMFQILSCTFQPITLYYFLAATLFLTTGEDTYPNLQRLSQEQMERRLNSRSAGLLEVTRAEPKFVQFIHQTVKEFIKSANGNEVLKEGLLGKRLESGYRLMFRYILKLCEFFVPDTPDHDAQHFVGSLFPYYAAFLEWREEWRVADSFESAILGRPKTVEQKIILCILSTIGYEHTGVNWIVRKTHTCRCLFFFVCNLPLSFKDYVSRQKINMDRDELHVVLDSISSSRYGTFTWYDEPRRSAHLRESRARFLQILMDEGLVA